MVNPTVASNSLLSQATRYNNLYLHKPEILQPGQTSGRGIDGLDGRTIAISEWVARVGAKEQHSNFLFPTKMEGPDLVFFLRSDNRMSTH